MPKKLLLPFILRRLYARKAFIHQGISPINIYSVSSRLTRRGFRAQGLLPSWRTDQPISGHRSKPEWSAFEEEFFGKFVLDYLWWCSKNVLIYFIHENVVKNYVVTAELYAIMKFNLKNPNKILFNGDFPNRHKLSPFPFALQCLMLHENSISTFSLQQNMLEIAKTNVASQKVWNSKTDPSSMSFFT